MPSSRRRKIFRLASGVNRKSMFTRWIGSTTVRVVINRVSPRGCVIREKASISAERSRGKCCWVCCEANSQLVSLGHELLSCECSCESDTVRAILGDAGHVSFDPCSVPCEFACPCCRARRTRRKRGLRVGKNRSRGRHPRRSSPIRPSNPKRVPVRKGKRALRASAYVFASAARFATLVKRVPPRLIRQTTSMAYRRLRKQWASLRSELLVLSPWACHVTMLSRFPSLVERIHGVIPSGVEGVGSRLKRCIESVKEEIDFREDLRISRENEALGLNKETKPHMYVITCAFCRNAYTSHLRSARCSGCKRLCTAARKSKRGRPFRV
jgi:hypothetical protein